MHAGEPEATAKEPERPRGWWPRPCSRDEGEGGGRRTQRAEPSGTPNPWARSRPGRQACGLGWRGGEGVGGSSFSASETPSLFVHFFRESGLRGQLRSRVKKALGTEDGWMRGRWCPAGDPAPLNRELRAAPGDIPRRGEAGDPGEDPGQRSLSDGFSTSASEPLSWSRRGWGNDICVGRGGSRSEGYPPPSPLARVPLSAESRRMHGRKPPTRLRLRCCLPNTESARSDGQGPIPEPSPSTPVPPTPAGAWPTPPPCPVGPSAEGEAPPRGASGLLQEDASWDRGPNPHGKSF